MRDCVGVVNSRMADFQLNLCRSRLEREPRHVRDVRVRVALDLACFARLTKMADTNMVVAAGRAISTQATTVRSSSRGVIGVLEEVDLLTATDDTDAGRVLVTCVRLINEAQETDESVQLCAYLLSIILAVFPGLETEAQTAVEQLGGKPILRIMPAASETTAIVLEDNAESTTCLLMFAQAVLVIFKNVQTNNYDTFCRNRINALRAIIGVPPSMTDVKAFDFRKASTLKARVGSCTAFRKELVLLLIAASRMSNNVGRVCAYLTSILAWTEMSAFVFIKDTLLCTNSPVLKDPRVFNEVRALADAFSIINESTYPQFFRILKTPAECKLLERNRFPILLAIATKLRSLVYPTVSQFVSSLQNDPTVLELYDLHVTSRPRNVTSVTNIIQYLTNFDDEDYAIIEEPEELAAPANPPVTV